MLRKPRRLTKDEERLHQGAREDGLLRQRRRTLHCVASEGLLRIHWSLSPLLLSIRSHRPLDTGFFRGLSRPVPRSGPKQIDGTGRGHLSRHHLGLYFLPLNSQLADDITWHCQFDTHQWESSMSLLSELSTLPPAGQLYWQRAGSGRQTLGCHTHSPAWE